MMYVSTLCAFFVVFVLALFKLPCSMSVIIIIYNRYYLKVKNLLI